MQYVTYDYEDDRFWHIYSLDQEPDGVDLPTTILTVEAPLTPEWERRIAKITDALDELVAAKVAASQVQPDPSRKRRDVTERSRELPKDPYSE